jgi:N-carbamoyl-L-amino-acid hydrolase
MRNLQINGERLWGSLMELAQIGATEKGGVCRLAASDLDGQARRLFIHWCEEAGCSVQVDRIGNMFARRPGRDPSLAPVMTGSHLDTQPTGGKFDGAYGVMAALEVVRTLNDVGYETQVPIEIVLDQRGGLAFFAGNGRLGGVRRDVRSLRGAGAAG